MQIISPKNSIGIVGIASALGEAIISSDKISELSNFSKDEIVGRLGFLKKRIVSTGQSPSTLALKAAKGVLHKTGVNAKQLAFVIYCSNGLFDHEFWSPSAKIQHEISATKAIAFELNNGCNSAMAGLFMSASLLDSLASKNAYGMVVVADSLSKYVDYTDPNSFPFFSCADAASAIILAKNIKSNILKTISLHSEGKYNGCFKLNENKKISCDNNDPATQQLLSGIIADHYIQVIKEVFLTSKCNPCDISLFLFNQNSQKVLNTVIKKLNIPQKKLYPTITNYGHLGGVDAIFAFEKCLANNILTKNQNIILATAGVGYHWGACLLRS